MHSPIRAWALLCSAPGVGTGSCKSYNRDPPGPQFKRNSWMRENYIQHQPEPALQEQSYGPFTMDHYRIRQSIRMKNDPYLSFSGILLHRETCGAGDRLNHCVLLGSVSLLLLLGSFCSFVSFGAGLHSCLCSIVFPFTSSEGFNL